MVMVMIMHGMGVITLNVPYLHKNEVCASTTFHSWDERGLFILRTKHQSGSCGE